MFSATSFWGVQLENSRVILSKICLDLNLTSYHKLDLSVTLMFVYDLSFTLDVGHSIK
jgi:hypothetical protein